MAGKPTHDWGTDDELVALVAEHGTLQGAAEALGVAGPTLRYQLVKRGLMDRVNAARARHAAGVAEPAGRAVVSTDPAMWGDMRLLLEGHNLRPSDWNIKGGRVNSWGGPDGTDNAQLRVDIEPAYNLLAPARSDGWRAPKRAKLDRSKPFMFVATGDRHCPWHDPGLHAGLCEFLRQFEPELFVDVGDVLDFAALSRHRANPALNQSPQDCISTAYTVKRAEVEASLNTRHVMLPGNHDWRLRNDRIDKQPAGYGLRRADNPDLPPEQWPTESLPHKLRLDELGVTFIGGDDDYDQYEFEIAPGIVALHGYKSRPKAGQTAQAMIDDYAMSVVLGHVHRQAITPLTKPDLPDGTPRQYWGMEVGGAYVRGHNLGYDHRGGNHQHGFGTGIVWPDGRHLFELATWDGTSLTWRDWRCTP